MGEVIGSARMLGNLYILDEAGYPNNKDSPYAKCFQLSFNSNNKKIRQWHERLGHPSLKYMQMLFLDLISNKDLLSFRCETCALYKHHRV
ncbi:UNVERIFIED_CONTAM: GAG-pre-integrase domain-containing protein, partial [Salmonella enterica subsp. enterica serovar Weltevreden]